jgi:hypothetical protein
MYSASGTPLSLNFKVNDTDAGARWPAVAVDSSGNFVVTWEDQRDVQYTSWNIYAQRYDSSGVPIGSNFKVNDDDTWRTQWVPDIAMHSSGSFVITWMDERIGFNIFAQRYNADGIPIDTNFQVNHGENEWHWQGYPAIAMDGSGRFVITWFDWNWDSKEEVYAQIYDSEGNSMGSNFRVGDTSYPEQRFPDVAMDPAGRFVITWLENHVYGGGYDVYAQRYYSDGTPAGSGFKVNDSFGHTANDGPAIAVDDSGNFVIA